MKKLIIWIVIFALLVSFNAVLLENRSFKGNITLENCREKLTATEHGIKADSIESAKVNTAAINRLISSAPDGSAIYFPSGKYYIEADTIGINIFEKNGLMLYGEDASFINTSFDPTENITDKNYQKSSIVSILFSKNIRIEGFSFDYLRYTQVCGKIVEKTETETAIELDSRFLEQGDKPKITGKEIASAVAVLDEKGAATEDYYADGSYATRLEGNKFYLEGDFGDIGMDAVVRFNISTAPVFYAQNAQKLTFRKLKSFSSPAALFLMSGEGNENFNFYDITVAPPKGAHWRWGCNVDGIFLNSMRGEVNVKNCTFSGMGDDALNVHSSAAKVTSLEGNKIEMNYGYNDAPVSGAFAKAGDSFVFYKSDFSISARAKIKSVLFGKITLDITEGSVSVGDIAENTSLSPKLTVENVTVDGGRARAFLIQTDIVLIKNCDIKNLGLAGIIISPDINRWFEMGPSENIEISGCSFQNVCAMDNNACKGAIFSASSHDGNETDKMIHKNIKIIGNTFSDIPVFSVNLTSVDGGEIKNNNYNDVVIPITTNCENISID